MFTEIQVLFYEKIGLNVAIEYPVSRLLRDFLNKTRYFQFHSVFLSHQKAFYIVISSLLVEVFGDYWFDTDQVVDHRLGRKIH